MRVLLAILLCTHAVLATQRAMNLPCNRELDGLLAMDPDGNSNSFLSCQGVGVGNIGFWERKVCPNDMVFDFINQQCKTPAKKHRKPAQHVLNIAILNNSCAKGETCIGGTVCDLDSLKCLCPYGTLPQIDTLSCVKADNSFGSSDINKFSSFGQSPNSFLPNPQQTQTSPGFLQPNPNFKFNNFNFGNNNNNNKNPSPSFNSQWKPSYPANNFGNGNDFQPNPSQKFVFPNFGTTPGPLTSKKVPILAEPGQSCRNNEICSGGAICTLPIALCLCPGDLEARDGECVLPPTASIKIQKVGIGALCSDLAECDHGSVCTMGRCACVSPLIQFEGKCVLRQERKEVGPGELCDNGEICSHGSICDTVIPVCVCPKDTDLSNGQCIRVFKTTAPPPVVTTQPTTQRLLTNPPTTPAPMTYAPQPPKTVAPTFNYNSYNYQTTQPPRPPPTAAPATYKTNPPYRPTVKPNQMKINLGGSKQAGVGVRCSLNTDCMIGAYCNGNTNPPSCQCLSTHVNIEGRCEKVVYPGQIGCRSDTQCSAAYTGTSCIDRLCVCPEGSKAVDQTCVPANEPVTSPPGGSCTEARECTGGSVCREGWCICPHPTMIVQKGICIQSGPRPTLPPKAVNVYTTSQAPVYQTAAPVATYKPTNTFNALPSAIQQGRKVPPGSQCGPLDSCVGGASCLDAICVCPVGSSPSQHGRCEATPSTTPRPTTTRAIPSTSSFAKPGEDCSEGRTCVGGSFCSANQNCECPKEKSVIKNGECSTEEKPSRRQGVAGESCDANTECINGSVCQHGQCRCEAQYISVSGYCVQMPMSSTPKMKTFAKPLENCEDGEICEGGSSCNEDTGVCMCPPGQIAFGPECKVPPSRSPSQEPQAAPEVNRPTTECADDSNCGEGKLCVAGRCRCRPGTVDNAGTCEPLEGLKPSLLKYGQPCDVHRDRCTNGAKCIEKVCKCTNGLLLSTSGWCERPDPRKVSATFSALPHPDEKSIESPLVTRPDPTQAVPFWPIPNKPTMAPYLTAEPPIFTMRPVVPMGLPIYPMSSEEEAPRTVPIYERPFGQDNLRPIKPLQTIPPATVRTMPPTTPSTRPPTTTTTTTTTTTPTTTTTTTTTSAPPTPGGGPRIRGRPAGASCRTNDICLGGSTCSEGRCICPPGLDIIKGQCTKKPIETSPYSHPGESCAEDQQCVGGSICDADTFKCICAARHIVVDRVCKSKEGAHFVSPGSTCAQGQICSGGSLCVQGECQCDNNHYAEDGYCRHIASRSSQIGHDSSGALRFSSKAFQPRRIAQRCNEQACQLPDCFCTHTGRRSPLPNSPIHDVPQFIVLTFDDAVNGRTLPDYLTLFQNVRYRNPNGCPIKGTFFVSHEWTNYDAVQWLADHQMELASNSISHVSLAGENASRWLNEMEGQKRIMAKFSNSFEEDIIGMRAPQLAAGGNAHFEMMARAGFVYDNTLSANPGVHGEPYWPQTLDYQVPWNCHEENCPTESFPGLWEIPLNQFYGTYLQQIDSYRRSSMIRAAVDLNNTVDELKGMLLSNFDRAYTSNRAPFVLSLNADFLQLNGRNSGMQALTSFLDEVMQNKDIFVVTMRQLIDWMKEPLPMTEIHKSSALRCSNTQFSQNPSGTRQMTSCSKPNKCMYRTPHLNSQEHQFLTCTPCPEVYPWLDSPVGYSPSHFRTKN